MLNSFRPCVLLRYRSVLIYLIISLAVRCIVGMLNFFYILVPKLDSRYVSKLLYRTNKNDFSSISILLLTNPALWSINSCRIIQIPLAKAFGRIVLSLCLCHEVVPSLFRFASVVIILSQSLANCATHGISVIKFFNSLKFSPYHSLQFHSHFFFISCLIRSFFSRSFDRKFAIDCFAPRNDSTSLLDVGDFICEVTFIFPLLVFNPWSVISYRSPVISLRKMSVLSHLPCIRILEVYRVLWLFLFRCFTSSPQLVLFCHLTKRSFDFSIFYLFCLRILSGYRIDRRIVFLSKISVLDSSRFALSTCLFG